MDCLFSTYWSILPIINYSNCSYRYIDILTNVPKIRYSYSKLLYLTVSPIQYRRYSPTQVNNETFGSLAIVLLFQHAAGASVKMHG